MGRIFALGPKEEEEEAGTALPASRHFFMSKKGTDKSGNIKKRIGLHLSIEFFLGEGDK